MTNNPTDDEVSQGWRPIESAPKEGICLVTGHYPDDGQAYASGWQWWNIANCTEHGIYGDWICDLEPTHWMPLAPLTQGE